MNVSAVLFDLDGTLLDSAPDLVGALNWLRASEGLKALPVDKLRAHASRGAMGLLRAGMPAAKPNQIEEWRKGFLARYAQYSYCHSRLYEGIPAVLDYLDDKHIPWGIVTNKSEQLTHSVLDAAGIAERASCVVCGDTLPFSKPHPAPVLHACTGLSAAASSTLFVGDDVRDLQAGRAAGTQVAAVMYGYGSAELDERLVGNSLKVRHPGDLVAHLEHFRETASRQAK